MFNHPWIATKLTRKFLLGNAAGILLSSLVFLVFYLGMYQEQLRDERSKAATQVNQLLETSLQNAMLKRDLEGLSDIVGRLGGQREIVNVMILNPAGQVRFSSNRELLGRVFDRRQAETCTACHVNGVKSSTAFITNEMGRSVLRSVNPVPNQPACVECHGSIDTHPVNGVLFVDYDAAPIQQKARKTALVLMLAGACVLLIVLSGGWWFMRRFVLKPVHELNRMSQSLSNGVLSDRVDIVGRDELAQLGLGFNDMAAELEKSLTALREKEAFLQGLVDATPDGLRVLDGNFTVILANEAYCRQLGRSKEEVVGVPCYQSSHARQEPCAPTLVTCPIHEIRQNPEPVKCVHRHVRSDGSSLEVEVYAAPMPVTPGGQAGHFIVESIRDLDSTLQFSHEQKLSELGRLAAGVAHEIYNPLTSIRMSLDSVGRLQNPDDTLQEERAAYLELVEQEIDRCIEITGRLLKLSANNGSQAQLVAVNEAVRETASLVSWDASQSGVVIVEELDGSGPRVYVNDSDLRMAILNLIQNAFHAMPQGGRLTLRSGRRDDRITVEIIDTGVGIAPSDMARIFDPFFSRRADGKRGTGLGLSISQANIRRNGGDIRVESELGRGTAFIISFADPEV